MFILVWYYLAVQSVGQKKQSPIKAPRWAKCFLVLEEESRSQATRLHWWFVVNVVLIQNPLRARQDAKVVCSQLNRTATTSWKSTHNFSEQFIIYCTNYKMYICWITNNKPVFESLTCSMACLVLTPESWKSLRRPPLSPSFTCWNPAEICRTADKNKVFMREREMDRYYIHTHTQLKFLGGGESWMIPHTHHCVCFFFLMYHCLNLTYFWYWLYWTVQLNIRALSPPPSPSHPLGDNSETQAL